MPPEKERLRFSSALGWIPLATVSHNMDMTHVAIYYPYRERPSFHTIMSVLIGGPLRLC